MKTYLAVAQKLDLDAFMASMHPRCLISFAYQKVVDQILKVEFNRPIDLIIDSGAWTLFNTKRADHDINVLDYIYWIDKMAPVLHAKFRSVHFVCFDAIGDHRRSMENFQLMKALGINSMPVVHYGSSDEEIEEVMAAAPFVAIGGLVPLKGVRKEIVPFLDRCTIIAARYQTDLHLLGMMREWVLKEYPWVYSCDSTTWAGPLRFGMVRYSDDLFPGLPDKERRYLFTIQRATAAMRFDTPDPIWALDYPRAL